MTSIIETIKAKVDVVEEIGLVVALQKSGKSLKGVCPFHNERTPSFHVFAESQTWHCFGCHEGGDVFSFVEKHQGLDFHGALVYLAEKAGVPLEEVHGPVSEEEQEASATKERLRKLNEDALLWFHQMLLRSREASQARAYIQQRGIEMESIVNFSLGYAPEGWDNLSRYLLNQGYTEHELVTGGLARERVDKDGFSKSGGVYDYFRNRLIFPIRDIRGRVIGFGGRAIGDEQPKYLNSPQTPLFDKSSVLYALDMAKDAIKHAKQVIIVEGYVDALIAHQFGTKQTVACIGSAITEKHIQQLKRLTKQVTLALDPDAAGESATEHGIQEALKTFDRTIVPVPLAGTPAGKKRNEPRGMIRLEEQVDAEINVLQLPAGQDPDEVIMHNPSLWTYAVTHPLPLVDYYFMAKTVGLNVREPYGQAEAAKRLLPVIGMISDRIKRDAYIRKLAQMISSDERSLHAELQRVLRSSKANASIAEFSAPTEQKVRTAKGPAVVDGNTAIEKSEARLMRSEQQGVNGLDRRRSDKLQWEDYLIGLLLQNPGLNPHICGIIDDGDFAGTDTRELYRILNSIYQRGSSSSNQPFENLVPSSLLTAVERARKRVELESPLDGAGQVKAAVQCATRLKRTRLTQLNTDIQFLLQEAQKAGDTASVRQFQQQLLTIHQQLRTLHSAMHLHG